MARLKSFAWSRPHAGKGAAESGLAEGRTEGAIAGIALTLLLTGSALASRTARNDRYASPNSRNVLPRMKRETRWIRPASRVGSQMAKTVGGRTGQLT